MEYCVFVKDLVDCSATTHGVIFAKYVAQITKQQGRYAVGHGLSPLGNRASLSRCMHRRKVAARRGVLIVQIIDCRNQAITLIVAEPVLFLRRVAHTILGAPFIRVANEW